MTPPLDVVTGAYGYTGRYLTRRLLETGRSVRTLTANPSRPGRWQLVVPNWGGAPGFAMPPPIMRPISVG